METVVRNVKLFIQSSTVNKQGRWGFNKFLQPERPYFWHYIILPSIKDDFMLLRDGEVGWMQIERGPERDPRIQIIQVPTVKKVK